MSTGLTKEKTKRKAHDDFRKQQRWRGRQIDTDRYDDFDSLIQKKFRTFCYNTIIPKLAAALDPTKMSDRKSTFVITEAARSLGHSIDDVNIKGQNL